MRALVRWASASTLALAVGLGAAACGGSSDQGDGPSGLAQVSPPEPEPPVLTFDSTEHAQGPAAGADTAVPSESQPSDADMGAGVQGETMSTPVGTAPETTSPAAPADGPADAQAQDPADEEPPAADVPVVRVRDLEPVGGVAKIRTTKGERVRFEVRSDVADEVHVHGFDLSKPVGPGRPARFSFVAELDGIFEVELEESGVEVAQIRVDP